MSKLNKLENIKPIFNIVLNAPDIPGNTGSIGRTCLATNCHLILIHPLGFDLSEKSVRRAGLDYWKYVDITEYQNWDEFLNKENVTQENSHFFTKTAKKLIYDSNLNIGDYLIFGSETKGLPKEIMDKHQGQLCSFPMFSDKLRSINLSNIVTSAIYCGIGDLR